MGVEDFLLFICPLHVILRMGFRTSYCSGAFSMCFYGWGLGPPIVHVPSPCVPMDVGLGCLIVHISFPCVSMDVG